MLAISVYFRCFRTERRNRARAHGWAPPAAGGLPGVEACELSERRALGIVFRSEDDGRAEPSREAREGRGGSWASADLTEEAVASIRALVGSDVHRFDGTRLPFGDAEFDRVVVVDMLEHVADDGAFVAELARVTKPGGRLVVNTPHLKRTLLRRLRGALGQTDEKHGHLRAGYMPESLRALLGDCFTLESHHTYSRFFSELADTAIHWGLGRVGKKGSAKGMVVTGDDLRRHARMFKAYSVIYPVMGTLCSLDALIPWASGYMLIATARRRD